VNLVLVGWLVCRASLLAEERSGALAVRIGDVQQEIAQLVSRNCLTFAPTDRDRADFRRLGAEAPVLAAIDGCGRRATRPAPAR